MNRFCNRVAIGATLVVSAFVASACGGPPGTTARSGADQRLPADGSAGGPGAGGLKTKALTQEEWMKITSNHLRPACDARSGAGAADETTLKNAGAVMTTWAAFVAKPKPGPSTDDGKKIGGAAEPTRTVKTIGMTCSAAKNTVEVNGNEYPFDVAWVVSGKGEGPDLNGGTGAGNFAMVEALNIKQKKVLFAKVYVPGDGNDDTDDTVIFTDLGAYMPDDADLPIVRATGPKESPVYETYVFAKGHTSGLAFQVPKQDPLGRARYLAADKFTVQ